MLYTTDKLALLIDGQALTSVGHQLNMKIDYRRLKTHFARSAKLTTAKYYAVVDTESVDNPYMKLLDWLEYNGYRVHKKAARVYENNEGSRNIKGSVVTDLSVDMVMMATHVDHIILASGYHDYTYAVTQAQRLGARVSLLSSLQVDGFRPADELRRIADDVIELDHLRSEIAITDSARTAA